MHTDERLRDDEYTPIDYDEYSIWCELMQADLDAEAAAYRAAEDEQADEVVEPYSGAASILSLTTAWMPNGRRLVVAVCPRGTVKGPGGFALTSGSAVQARCGALAVASWKYKWAGIKPSQPPFSHYLRSLTVAKNVKEAEMRYVIVRTYSAGVFAGELDSRQGQEVVLLNARRLWYWSGAASLSQLAVDGTSKPDGCKFPCEVPRVELLQAIEILDVTDKARESIKGVKIWQQ